MDNDSSCLAGSGDNSFTKGLSAYAPVPELEGLVMENLSGSWAGKALSIF